MTLMGVNIIESFQHRLYDLISDTGQLTLPLSKQWVFSASTN